MSVAEIADGTPRLVSTIDDIARHHASSRMKIRRALDALERVGFCTLWGTRGTGGMTQIVINDSGAFGSTGRNGVTDDSYVRLNTQDSTSSGVVGDHWREPDIPSQPTITTDHFQVSEISSSLDLDLSGSTKISDPDPRSEDLTRTEDMSPTYGTTIWAEPAENRAPEAAPKTGPKMRSVTIPDRAWGAADYLRGQVLAENKSAILGRHPWAADQKTGLRLSWADTFRLLHARVLGAMRNERPEASPDDAWNEIARTVHWLFRQPIGPARFEVECPRSLGTKWDRIQRTRRRHAEIASQPQLARGADNRPDPQAAREFKRW